ncbi:MAG TPA: hypothetical protein VK168_19925 [Saprospiraceae bacterium]|nr:hypothetical protein [Saprospiraceae bacterium]
MAKTVSIPFITFQEFHTLEDAEILLDLLKKHKIYHKVEAPKPIMDTVMGGSPVTPKYFIKLYADDFKKVNLLFESETFKALQEGKISTAGHFLEEYTNEELKEVVKKPDEWSPESAAMARHLLHSRGIMLDDSTLDALREERISQIGQPKKGSSGWIVALYILSFGGISFFFLSLAAYMAVVCICLGMSQYYWRDITTDPYGKRFYTFDSATRLHGKVNFGLTMAMNILLQVWYFVWGS